MKKYDAFEIHPVRQVFEMDGSTFLEMIEECDIGILNENEEPIKPYCWSVYGHIEGKGIECIADCETKENAEYIKQALYCLLLALTIK